MTPAQLTALAAERTAHEDRPELAWLIVQAAEHSARHAGQIVLLNQLVRRS